MKSDGFLTSPGALRPDPGEVVLLQLVNSAYTADDLRGSLEEAAADPDLAQALMHHRGRIGAFRTIADIADVEGLDAHGLDALVGAFGRPPVFDPEAETLEYVVWTHGSALTVQNPERFGRVEHRATGLRLHSLPQPRGARSLEGRSNVTAAIATPAYALGKQFHVRSVLVSMESDPVPFDVLARPVATPIDVSVWDGHQKVASAEIRPFAIPANRYLRVPIVSVHKVRTGIAVSLDVYVMSVPESVPGFWLDINAVGVEFVTRSGGVVATNQ